AGPFLIAAIRQTQINAGVAHNLVYDRTLYILAGLLFVGFILNLLVRPVDPKYRMTAEELAQERALKHEDRVAGDALHAARGAFGIVGVLAWAAVGIPFLIGVFIALQKAAVLF
ncbi:MAG: MFS transporter small subunit, partial [Thiomonas delicata]